MAFEVEGNFFLTYCTFLTGNTVLFTSRHTVHYLTAVLVTLLTAFLRTKYTIHSDNMARFYTLNYLRVCSSTNSIVARLDLLQLQCLPVNVNHIIASWILFHVIVYSSGGSAAFIFSLTEFVWRWSGVRGV